MSLLSIESFSMKVAVWNVVLEVDSLLLTAFLEGNICGKFVRLQKNNFSEHTWISPI